MNDIWLISALVAAFLGLGLLCLYWWVSKRRYARDIGTLHEEIVDAAENAAFGKRITGLRGSSELIELGDIINQLFDALHSKDGQLRQAEAMFPDLVNTMPEVVVVHRKHIIFANHIAAGMLGVTAAQLTGKPYTDMIRPAYRAMMRKSVDKRLAGEEVPEKHEIQLINGEERGLWFEITSGLINYRGQPAILSIGRDISYRKSIEANLGRSKHQAQVTLESIGEGVITTDTQGIIDYMNLAAERLTGVARNHAVGKTLADIVNLVDETDRRDLGDPVARCLMDRRQISMGRRAVMVSADGNDELSIELTASPIKGVGEALAGVVVIMHDVTEMRGLNRQMSYQAAHDPLTGLINRREFERRLELSLGSAHKAEVNHILCYLDLDRFKVVNDTCGHAAGDNMLREVATLIRDQVRDSDFVARLGGDEFGLLLFGCPLKKARQIADDVCTAVRDYRFVWQDRIFTIGVSIGLVEVGREAGTMKEMLSAADSACYIAKQQGRGQVHIYSAKDEVSARQRGEIRWLHMLQTALKEDRFEIHTQPIISVTGKGEHGPAIEILLRMIGDDGQFILPKQFIQAAERYQLMVNVDRWVVQSTLAAVGQGAIRLPENRSCSINLSGQTLGEESFLEFVVDCLDHSQVDPVDICFEITESAVMANLEQARRFVDVLHGMGCQFGLDDFGSGVGSLARLKDLSIDYLKIDGAYTHDLGEETLNRQVVVAVTKMARAVGFRVIAEQVEEQEDFDALRDIGVDFIQGYFVNHPRPLGESNSPRH